MKTIIHVNQHNIKHNKKFGSGRKVISVKTSKTNRYGNRAIIHGPSSVVYHPEKPLKCGATVWIETQSEVTIEP